MEATPEQTAEGLAIVRVLSAVLERLVDANGQHLHDPIHITKFHAMKAPGIAIQQYLERIHKYASCSNECFILALIYIDRLIQRNDMMLTELNLHRVVLTAILLAAKFFDDAYYNNAYYAKVGGVLVSELNGLEVDFLFRINFSLRVTPDEFEKYRRELMSRSDVVAAGLSTIAPAELPLSCPAPIAPKVYYTENCAATEQSRYHSDCSHQSCPQETVDKSLITPSPPSTAAASDMVEALVNAVNNSPDSFYTRLGIPSVNRTNSMPVLPKSSSPSCYRQHHGSGRPQHQHQQPYYHMPNSDPVHVRCSRPMSAMPQFPRPDDPFGVMNMNGTLLYKTVTTHISCTTTTPLIHHHHGGSFHHNSISDSGYVVVSMSDTGS